MAIPIEGGPFDGGRATSAGGWVRWLGAGADEVYVAHKSATEGRAPYFRESTRWSFCGFGWTCPRCKCRLDPARSRPGQPKWPSKCGLCGSPLHQ